MLSHITVPPMCDDVRNSCLQSLPHVNLEQVANVALQPRNTERPPERYGLHGLGIEAVAVGMKIRRQG
jgi:hypothetical protein